MPVGPLEIVIVLLIALVIFGGKKLPQIGRKAGKGLRSAGDAADEFKDTVTGKRGEKATVEAGREPTRADAVARNAGHSVRDFKESVTGKAPAPSPDEEESIGQSAGRGLREFRDALAGRDEDTKADDAEVVQGEVVDRGEPPRDA